jgi:transformation/transcription domain-associated protein
VTLVSFLLSQADDESSAEQVGVYCGCQRVVGDYFDMCADSQMKPSSTQALSSLEYTEKLMGFLRQSHPALATELEAMLEEIIVRFRPDPEEELLSAVHALLMRCFQSALQNEVPQTLQSTLERVCLKFFSVSTKTGRHLEFVRRYKAAFERDFLNASSNPGGLSDIDTTMTEDGATAGVDQPATGPPVGQTLTQVIRKLKKWKHLLQSRVKCTPDKLKMEYCSRHLTEFQSTDIEIPGQYCHGMDNLGAGPDSQSHVKLVRFGPEVDILHRHGFAQRRLALHGDDGQNYHFLVQFAIPHLTRTDERMMQLQLLLNQLLLKDQHTRQRNMGLHVPVVVPITPRVRLMSDAVSLKSLGEVYEDDRMARGLDSDAPIMLWRRRFQNVADAKGNPEAQNVPLQVYEEINRSVVPDTLLTRYVCSMLPSADHVWNFKKQFAVQLAMSSLMSYCLCIGEQSPHRMLFNKSNGRIYSPEFRPGYNQNGSLECTEAVPFRLTRNLYNFVTPFCIDGVFASAMSTMAQCLVQRQKVLESQLSLLLRDDLLSWHSSKTRPQSESEQQGVEVQLNDRITSNVQQVLKKAQQIAPKFNQAEVPGETASPNQKVFDLIEAATASKNLCQMNPTWLPWV